MNINVTSLMPETNSDLNTCTKRKINVKTAPTIQLTIGPSENFLSHIGTHCVGSHMAYAI